MLLAFFLVDSSFFDICIFNHNEAVFRNFRVTEVTTSLGFNSDKPLMIPVNVLQAAPIKKQSCMRNSLFR